MKLLISRLRASRCEQIAKALPEFSSVVTIDHCDNENYKAIEHKFSGCYFYQNGTGRASHIREIIRKHGITHAIIAQKRNDMADDTFAVCVAEGVKCLWAERFFDDKLILDYSGLQYEPVNDMVLYEHMAQVGPVDHPKENREAQPDAKTNDEIYEKYGRDKVVIFGQLPRDKSIDNNTSGLSYNRFLEEITVRNDPDDLLFKPHPLYANIPAAIDRAKIQLCEENLYSLLCSYDAFVSFSSTTIFEAVMYGKKVITGGYHLCSGGQICVEATKSDDLYAIKRRLAGFTPCEDSRLSRMSFVTNYYAVSMNSSRLADKLIMRPEEFYGRRICA